MATTPSAPSTDSSKAPAKKVAKPAVKPAAKPVGKPAVKTATKPAVKAVKQDTATVVGKAAAPQAEKAKKPVKPVEADKQPKAKKPKLVRDSFTIPKDEYQVIDILKQRSAKLGQPMKKSELLRAGIKLLNRLDDTQFKQAVAAVPAIKTGRPQKTK